MKAEVLFIERKKDDFVSIEKVFRQIDESLSKAKFKTDFQQMTYGNSLLGMIKNLIFFRPKKADIYHITGHIHYISLILPRKRTVLTIHDLGFLHTRKGLRRYVLKKLLLDFPLKKLKYVTAISEATKREILRYTNCPEEKIRVIENPLHKSFYEVKEKSFNEKSPVVLQIGTSPNKNVLNLIKSLEGINCRLRIIGRLDQEHLTALNENKIEYENVFGLDDEAVRKEYENADIVAFCSTYEGFGLPIIESQAMMRAVVTSNLSPMKDVAGDGGAYLVNPDDYLDIRAKIETIIKDERLRKEFIKKGIQNVKRFEPQTIARAYENLYEEILNS